MQTGVTALGLLLLRVADPHFKTPRHNINFQISLRVMIEKF
jgi:hypothetical protein